MTTDGGSISAISAAFVAMQQANPTHTMTFPGFGTDVTDEAARAMIHSDVASKGNLARRYPAGSSKDTIMDMAITDRDIVRPHRSLRSVHELAAREFIRDDEVRRVILHPDDFDREIDGIKYGITPYGRVTLQQVGWRGCAAASVAMLLMDHGITPDIRWTKRSEITRIERKISVLHDNGLNVGNVSFGVVNRQKLGRRLEHLLGTYYSGTLSVGGEVGGHSIVLDYFSMNQNLAIIREPYHGWALATTASAILRRSLDHFIGVIP